MTRGRTYGIHKCLWLCGLWWGNCRGVISAPVSSQPLPHISDPNKALVVSILWSVMAPHLVTRGGVCVCCVQEKFCHTTDTRNQILQQNLSLNHTMEWSCCQFIHECHNLFWKLLMRGDMGKWRRDELSWSNHYHPVSGEELSQGLNPGLNTC